MSPLGQVGGMIGMSVAEDPEAGLETGALVGNALEAGAGVGGIAMRELHFQYLKKIMGVTSSDWKKVRPLIQEVYDLGDPATRRRFNLLIRQSSKEARRGKQFTEYIDLSHWKAQRDIKGYEWFFNRPWNAIPKWETQHALVDSYKFNFMTKDFKLIYGGQQLQGLMKHLQLAPPGLVRSGASSLNLVTRRSLTKLPRLPSSDKPGKP
jgi:hypothetical protein